jgi:hypothetical protein
MPPVASVRIVGRATALSFGCACAIACGGPSFATSGLDADEASIVVPVEGAAGPSDASQAADGQAGGDGSPDAMTDATLDDGRDATDGIAPSDASFLPDGLPPPVDAAPMDAFVLDVVEEPPPPNCNGTFACVPAIPPGWIGPVELYSWEVVPDSGPTKYPACSENFTLAYDGAQGLDAQSATCECGCSANVACSTPSVILYGTAASVPSCTSLTDCGNVAFTPGVCQNLNSTPMCSSLATSTAMTLAASVANPGACTPQTTALPPAYTWNVLARGCISTIAPGASDCGSGSICAPIPASPYSSNLCIEQSGDVPCPSADYTVQHIFYGGVDDERGCGPCSCGSPGSGSCEVTVSVSSSTDGSCSGNTIEYPGPATCDPVQTPGDYRMTLTPSGGGCTASKGSPIGSAVPSQPTTLCCLSP